MASDNSGVEKSSTSLIKFKHFTYKWTIDDFENLLTKDLKTNNKGFKYIESDTFSPPSDDRVQFKLELYPNGDKEDAKNNVSVYLNLVSSVKKSNDVYFKISLLNEKNEEGYVCKTRYTLENTHENSENWGWPTFITCAHIFNVSNGLLSDGKLSLLVEINVVENEVKCELQNTNIWKNSLENFELIKFAKIINFSYEWKIKNFNSILNAFSIFNFNSVVSPRFHSSENDQIKFSLKLYPNGLREEYKDYLSLLLVLETCDKSKATINYNFAILDKSLEKLVRFVSMGDLNKGATLGSYQFITKNELLTKAGELLHEDTLTIICELQIFENEFLCKELPKERPIPQVTSILDNLNLSSNMQSSKTYTHLEVAKFGHTWTVGNFKVTCDEQLSKNAFLESQQFFSLSDDQIRFNLRMYPRGYGKESQKYVSIFLILATCEQTKATVECRISIVNAKGEKPYSEVLKGVIFRGSKRGFDKFIERDLLLNQPNKLLPDGKLTIVCELAIVGDAKTNFEKNPYNQALPMSLGEDYSKLLDTGELSDFSFIVEGKEIRAHKAILASRSPYFSAMFRQTTMKESVENRVEIADFSIEVMQDLLRYVYSGVYEPKDENIADLFIAAHRYELEKLKDLCENSLYSHVNADTASDLLVLADLYSADKLKTTLFDHINLHASWIMDNDEFTSKLSNKLLVELYRDLKKKQNF